MDANRFDALTRALTAAGSRRRALIGLVSGTLGLALSTSSVEEIAAKKKCPPCKKRKQGKCKKKKPDGTACPGGACQGGRCVAPTCSDGKKNGSETGVDCGGSCKRCGNGQPCLVANDCVSGTCTGGVCVTCTPTQLCGSDARGSCRCDEPFPSGDPVCDTGPAEGATVDDCGKCPVGTETCVTIAGLLFNCYKRCGSP